MGQSWVFVGDVRRYTKLQSLYLAGPGSVRSVGINQVFGMAEPAPCLCSSVVNDERWHRLPNDRLARRLGVRDLVEPTPVDWPDDLRSMPADALQAVRRFPLTEYCLGCGLLYNWDEVLNSKNGLRYSAGGKCPHKASGGHPKRGTTQQVEWLWACERGHLESVRPRCRECTGRLRRRRKGSHFGFDLECTQCGRMVDLSRDTTRPCSGLMPNAVTPGEQTVACQEDMHLHRAADPALWRPRMLTVLHLPRHIRLTEGQYDVVSASVTAPAYRRKSTPHERIEYVRDRLTDAGMDVDLDETTLEQVDATVAGTSAGAVGGGSDEEFLALGEELRREEMDQLDGLRRQAASLPLFEGGRARDLGQGPFSAVSGITRLRVTTVLDAAFRLSGQPGRALLWGHQPDSAVLRQPSHGSLPAFQSFGEGLLLWLREPQGSAGVNPATEAHTLAHVVIRALAVHAGVSQPSLRERVYLDPVPAILVYQASGDQVGTLGGLATLADRHGWLEVMLNDAVAAQQWCSLDPICREDRGAACHQCLYLPETSCEGALGTGRLNEGLSRDAIARWCM